MRGVSPLLLLQCVERKEKSFQGVETCHNVAYQNYRVVKLDFTTEIEVFYMLFERSISIFSMASLKQHTEFFNSLCTLWIKRIEQRKWNRGRNGLHQLGQPVAQSILFPVFNPPYPQGRILLMKL